MNPPLISIVTPSYNQGKFIEETILSVANQSYRNVELIIIDGGSTDNTVEIIRKHADKIQYWVSEKDNGQTHAIVKGLEKCRGEIFNWINSDDRLAENSLARIADIYLANDQPDLIAGSIVRFDESGKKVLHQHIDYWNNIPRTLGMGQMCQPGMFYKTEVVRKIGLNTSLHYSMDVDLFFRFHLLLEKPRTCYTDEILAEFRMHGDSKTQTDLGRKETSLFLSERIEIINWFILLFNDRRSTSKMKMFNAENEVVKMEKETMSPSKEKARLLADVVNYFLLEQLLIAFHTFEKRKIRTLITHINWPRIQPSLRRTVIGKLFRHFTLYVRNFPGRLFRRKK
jgi:glycosyltransferase involved in cell wall biosynthesis